MRSAPAILSALWLGATALAPTPYTVVLKSGRVLAGEIDGISRGVIQLVRSDGEALPLARCDVRAIEGDGPFADPRILWRDGSGEVAAPRQFLRLARGGHGGALEVAVGAYAVPDSDARVYLVGVIHEAHADYYRELPSILDAMDVVLYEGDESLGRQPRANQLVVRGRSSTLERAVDLRRRILGLEAQLDEIDYRRSFFRCADLPGADLDRALAARGTHEVPCQPVIERLCEVLFFFVDPQRWPRCEAIARPARALTAALTASIHWEKSPFFGDWTSIVVEERNRVALAHLDRTLRDDRAKRIAIFYGADHLPGLDRVLREELGYRMIGIHWLPAWCW